MSATPGIRLLGLLAAAVACGSPQPREPAPDHAGPVPSSEAQVRVAALDGERLPARGGAWSIGPFGVVPNPTTGKGPVVLLRRDREELWLPLETDSDVRDLEARVLDGEAGPPAADASASYAAGLARALRR